MGQEPAAREKPKIREMIVVEGKDDVSALRRAVEADVLITTGLGLTPQKISEIRVAAEQRGVIILTDPDSPGDKIRHILEQQIPNCKHAYITRAEGRCPKTGKYGVEYASPQAILRALRQAHAQEQQYAVVYEMRDLVQWGLCGSPGSAVRRSALCDALSIGHCNGKQLLRKLNSYQIPREEILKLL